MEEVRPGRKMVESGTEKLFYKTGTKELQAFAKEKLSCEKNIGFWLCVFAYLSHHELVFETQKNLQKILRGQFKKKSAHCRCLKPAHYRFSALGTSLKIAAQISSKDFFKKLLD